MLESRAQSQELQSAWLDLELTPASPPALFTGFPGQCEVPWTPSPSPPGPVLSRVFSSVWQPEFSFCAGAPRPDAADLLVPNLRAKCSRPPTSRKTSAGSTPGYPGVSGEPLGDTDKGGGSQSHLHLLCVEREARLEGQVGVLGGAQPGL